MHSPMTVAHEIPWPIPTITRDPRNRDRPQGPRASWFWYIGDRELYFHALVTIWHREPGDQDSGTVCKPGTPWRWHTEHWEFQVHPLQKWRRRIMTRCAECGGKSTAKNPVNCSLGGWDDDGPKVPWWYPEQHLYHHACSAKVSARNRERHEATEQLKTWDQYKAQISVLHQSAADLRDVGEVEAADYLLLDATRIQNTLEHEAEEVRAARRAAYAANDQEVPVD